MGRPKRSAVIWRLVPKGIVCLLRWAPQQNRGLRGVRRESSTGTAGRPLLPGLDRRSVLRPPGTGPHRVCRPRRLRGGRHLQGNRVGNEAGPCGATQGHGARSGTPDRRGAGNRAVAVGPQHNGLLATLKELEARRVSIVALNGMAFDLATPHGRMIATVLAGIAEFERELTQERIRSGIAAAKARGKRLGRQPGQRPKSDRLAPQVLASSQRAEAIA